MEANVPSESSVKISVLLDNGQYKEAMDEVIRKTESLNSGLKNGTSSGGALGRAFAFFKNSVVGQMLSAQGALRLVERGAAAVTNAIKDSVGKAIEFGEANSRFATVFRGATKEAEAMRDTLVTAYGMSRLEATKYLSSIQDILVPMGMERKAAAELSGEITKLAADLGSFNNMPTAQVVGDIQSALIGNYESMKKYGVILNDTILKEEARKRGLLTQISAGDLAAKSQLAYQLIVKSSGDALGDFARTSNQTANQIRILQANIANSLQKFGEGFLPGLDPVLKGINNLLDSGGALKRLTVDLISVQGEYKSLLDQLAGNQENLSKAERENAEVRAAVLQKKILELIQQSNKAYDMAQKGSVFTTGGSLREKESQIALLEKELDLVRRIQAGDNRAKQELDALARSAPASDISPRSVPFGADASYFADRFLRVRTIRQEIEVSLQRQKATIDGAIQGLSKLYQAGDIDSELFRTIRKPLQTAILQSLNKIPDAVQPATDSAGQKLGQTVVQAVYAQLTALERIDLRLKLNIINEPEAESDLRAALDRIRSGALYKAGEQAMRNGWALSERQQKTLNEALAIESRILEIERERERVQRDLTAAVDESRQKLAELERQSRKLIGDAVWTELKGRLSGATGAAVELGEALHTALNPDMDETRLKIQQLRRELGDLMTSQATGSTTTADGKNIGELIRSKTTELETHEKAANDAGTALIGAFAAVADAVAGMVESFVAAYRQTMEELDTAVMSSGDKARLAAEEGFEAILTGLAAQVPIVGNLLSQLVESIWETEAEKREKAIKTITSDMARYKHRLATGLIQSYSDQINYYSTALAGLREVGANIEEIEAMEKRVYDLRQRQTEELQRQAQLAADIAGLRSRLYGRDPREQMEYWQDVEATARGELTGTTRPGELSRDMLNRKAAERARVIAERDAKIQWLTPESTYRAYNAIIARLDAEVAQLQAEVAAGDAAIVRWEADQARNQELIRQAELQRKLLQRSWMEYEADRFEHELAMSGKTEEQKNAARLEYYEQYLKESQALNEYYDTTLREREAELIAEQAALRANIGETQREAINENIKLLQEEIAALNDARMADQDIWKLEEKILGLREAQTRQLKEQYGLLNDMGLLDLENIETVEMIARELAASGVTGMAQYAALKNMGVGNLTMANSGVGTTVIIEQMNSTLNEATPDALAQNQANLIRRAIQRGV